MRDGLAEGVSGLRSESEEDTSSSQLSGTLLVGGGLERGAPRLSSEPEEDTSFSGLSWDALLPRGGLTGLSPGRVVWPSMARLTRFCRGRLFEV
jgi:hypothetical protein